MNGTFRQSMSWLHTWAGLVLGWVLYFMFITGTVGYFNYEIDRWMQPEIPFTAAKPSQAHMLNIAEKRLQEVAPEATDLFIDFPVGRYPFLAIWWKNPVDEKTGEPGSFQNEKINLQTGKPLVTRDTGGGQLLYRMHYALHYIPFRLAYWITSLCAMFMLVALITGIVIHKKIFKDFFTFRPGKKQRSWLDMHNVLSVLPLPFHLMITYSGLIYLMFTTMPGILTASYGVGRENQQSFFEEIYTQEEHQEAAGKPAAKAPLSAMLIEAEQRWGTGRIGYIEIESYGDINAHITVAKTSSSGIGGGQTLTFNGVTGELQSANNFIQEADAPAQFYGVMTSLHEGLFANTILRWLYFLSGLMGAGMIATGMILWASKRSAKASKAGKTSKGLALVEYLNIGTIVGLPVAIAAYFWANRIIPVNLEARADWEVHTLFITWAIMLVHPYVATLFEGRNQTLTKVWIDQLKLASFAFGFLPILNLFTTDKHLGVTLLQGDWVMAGFDLSMLCISLCFGIAAYKIQRKQKMRTVSKKTNTSNAVSSEAASQEIITL